MRKIMPFILTLIILFGSSLPTTAVERHDYSEETFSDRAIAYLQYMRLFSAENVSAPISRGAAVSALVKALGQTPTDDASEEQMAEIASMRGILSGRTPESWQLNDSLTVEQAAKMFVVALNYNSLFPAEGAWPNTYLSWASKLKIIMKDGVVASGGVLTEADFAMMLYRAMHTIMLREVGLEEDSILYQSDKEVTLESVYLGAKGWVVGNGVIEADAYTNLYPGISLQRPAVRINGCNWQTADSSLFGYVGYNVDFVASEEDSVLIGFAVNKLNTVYTLNSDSNAEISDGKILFYNEAKNCQDSVKLNAPVYIKNNQLLTGYTADDIHLNADRIILIDNNADEKIDVIKTIDSESFIVDRVKEHKIYLKNGMLLNRGIIDIEAGGDRFVMVRDIDGRILNADVISSGSAVSVTASADFKYIEIILLNDSFVGEVESVCENEAVVNGKVYKIGVSEALTPGKSYTMWVNENNEIFKIETERSNCVYIVKKGIVGSLNKTAKIMIYDVEKGVSTLSMAEKSTVNGVTYNTQESAYQALPVDVPVRITQNAEGKLKNVETMAIYGEMAEREYREHASAFNDITYAESTPFRFNEDTLFFIIPENSEEDDYGVALELENNKKYMSSAYDYDKETGIVDVVVVKVQTNLRDNNNLTFNSDVGVVSNVSIVLTEDGQQTYKVDGFHEGKPFTYYAGQYSDVFSVCANLRTGDVIRYIVNYIDEIVRIERLAQLSTLKNGYHSGVNTANEQFFGQVLTLDKERITNESKYLWHQMGVSEKASYNSIVSMKFFADTDNAEDPNSEFNDIYTYNVKSHKLKPASVDDIAPYELVGDNASWVFVQRSKSDVRCIVIVTDGNYSNQ